MLNKRGNTMTTTRNLILEHLRQGKAITGLVAFELFRTLSLPQHIAALRGYGNDIDTEICKTPSGKMYARYTLKKQRRTK